MEANFVVRISRYPMYPLMVSKPQVNVRIVKQVASGKNIIGNNIIGYNFGTLLTLGYTGEAVDKSQLVITPSII